MRSSLVLFCFALFLQCSCGAAEIAEMANAPVGLEEQATVGNGKNLPTTVAWMLFGGVAMLMAVFYLTHHKDSDMVDATWLVISNAISLFCAILLFLAFREAVALITGGDDIQDRRLGASDAGWGQCWSSESENRRLSFVSRRLAGAPTQTTLAIDACCLVIVFAVWEAILFLVRKRESTLSALGLIAGHCIGFSTLYMFGNMQQCEPFRESPGLSSIVVVIVLVSTVLLSRIGAVLRGLLAPAHDLHEDSHAPHHHWLHQCQHTEREAMAFAVSFILSQAIEYFATDRLAPLHDVPKGRDISNAVAELCFTLVLAIAVIVAGYAEHAIASHHGHEELVAEKHGHSMTNVQLGMHMIKDTLAFTAGWSLLALLKITFWSVTDDKGLLGDGDVMTSHVVTVLISSVVTFVTFYIIDYTADRIHGNLGRGLRALGKAFMLFLGLCWECAFWEGAHSMSQGMGFDSETSRMLVVIVLSLVFTAVVMPAWIMYIVPHTFELHEADLHVKDYDDHESPTNAHKVSKTMSMTTMTGQQSVDDAGDSRSTFDEEAQLSGPSSSSASQASIDDSRANSKSTYDEEAPSQLDRPAPTSRPCPAPLELVDDASACPAKRGQRDLVSV